MIFHDMDSIEVEEMVRNAKARFQRIATVEHQKDEREKILKPISYTKKLNVEKTLTVEIKIPTSSHESTIKG